MMQFPQHTRETKPSLEELTVAEFPSEGNTAMAACAAVRGGEFLLVCACGALFLM